MRNFAKTICAIDKYFVKRGVSRQQRQQFWRDFIRDEAYREKFINDMRI
jgi:hypothetical protein